MLDWYHQSNGSLFSFSWGRVSCVIFPKTALKHGQVLSSVYHSTGTSWTFSEMTEQVEMVLAQDPAGERERQSSLVLFSAEKISAGEENERTLSYHISDCECNFSLQTGPEDHQLPSVDTRTCVILMS